MNLNLSLFPHRSGVTPNPNLSSNDIRLGDILTHRYGQYKVVVAHIEGSHVLLVDKNGRIIRQRIRRVVNRYCRRPSDKHGRDNVRAALLKALDALETDNRILSRIGLRLSQWLYVESIYKGFAAETV